MTDARLTVFNASAGSGKTFQIAVNFLNKIIQAQDKVYIYRLLGITFTNKAAGEMKDRIINNLISAASGEITGVMKVVAEQSKKRICKQTGITTDEAYKKEIIRRSKKRLFEILHRYDDFQLMTIDKLMYKIIRTFSRDMQLGNDVNVIIEYKEIISNIIDKLINQAEKGSLLSRFLIALALEKTEDEKYWDIKTDLINIGNIIFDEHNYENIKSLADKNLQDFVQLDKIIQAKIRKIRQELIQLGKELEMIIGQYNQYISNTFNTLAKRLQYEHSKVEINATIRKQYEANDYYYYVKKSVKEMEPELKALITGDLNDRIHQIIQKIVSYLDTYLEEYRLLKALLKEVKSLSIQNELQKELTAFKYENNSIFINDFNKLILENILRDLETDTPYIYMRLGEKYAHYFIDEFQDTSVLQWHNLIPLIKEGLSKEFSNEESGSAMIVGDAKQSIYRFRGGKPEQFIALSQPENISGDGNPFARISGKKVVDLKYNWRSKPVVVNFNNDFFTTFSSYLPPKYQTVYQKVRQEIPENNQSGEGYVQIRFLDKEDKKNQIPKESFSEAVLQAVQQAASNGFKLDEICILVDKKNKGTEIAEKLNENNIDVISSESLLVANACKVRFLLSWFRYIDSGKTEDLFDAVRYLSHQKLKNRTHFFQDVFYRPGISKEQQINRFKNFGYELDYREIMRFNLYDLAVYLIEKFQLNQDEVEQEYLQNFMEKIYQYYSAYQSSIREFLQEWESIAKDFSIHTPYRENAVQIMTVHKSKGLEFPVVIYYTEGKIFGGKDKDIKVWIPVNPDEYNGFKRLPVKLGSLEKSQNNLYLDIYQKIAGEKTFDNINRLYVAMTRAVEQLFVIVPGIAEKSDNTGYNNLLMNHLSKIKTENQKQIFEFGMPQRKHKSESLSKSVTSYDKPYYRIWQNTDKNKSLLKINYQNYEQWQESKKKAIKFGMSIHQILSKITSLTDWKNHCEKYLSEIDEEERISVKQMIEKLLHHPLLETYYQDDATVLNEQSILLPQGAYFTQKRPDRLVIKNGFITIIDYKTGEALPSHHKQVDEYAKLLKDMGFAVKDKILVYLNKNTLQVKSVK